MIISNRIYGLLALLFVGSASLMAQVTDPFPNVPFRKYYGNMQLTAKVMMNEEVLTGDVVIAIYYDDQIRGKGSPSDESHPGVAYLTVYGDYRPDHFHCKVAVNGSIIEVDPGDLAFGLNGVVGSASNPYVIDLPAPVVTKPSTEGWATTCLPFNAEVPEGVSVWYSTGIADGELLMTKAEGTILPANTPVLLQSEGKTSYEWLSRVADGNVTTTGSIFVGTTEPTVVAANSVLTLGHSNETGEIGFWRFTGTTIPANRAYITVVPAGVRGLVFKFDDDNETFIQEIENGELSIKDGIYDLQGRRIETSIQKKGIYIVNGKKYIAL